MRASVTVIAWVVLVAAGPAQAQVIFNANFNSQPLGPLATGTPPGLPQSIIADPGASVNVVAAAGNLTDKPVLLHSVPGSLASVLFTNPSQLSSGNWRVSWDSLVTSTPVNDPPNQGNIDILANSAGGNVLDVLDVKYLASGQFSVDDASGFHTVGSFSVGASDHFDLDLHLSSGTYQLFVDDRSLLSGTLAGNGQFLDTYFRSNGRTGFQLPDLAFDNLVVQGITVPEPSSLALSAVAMLSLVVARCLRTTSLMSGRSQRLGLLFTSSRRVCP